ncbi:putative arginine deiminase type-3 [Rosellinia necatrix]|uniref:Putative arginine deiminase type-3 n=1 Tax=Rosellinia necatrix TaxID=77044 RepID=A0A1S7UM16_ROSNE|nr:putative arginine deiminase type-3 [Rosellinia necatrix]
MALELYIPPCIRNPINPHHPPPPNKPLRIQIEGPLVAVERLFPNIQWHVEDIEPEFPQPAGPKLAELAYSLLYGRNASPDIQGDLVVRHEYLGWIMDPKPVQEIDYYGVTFDHFVPSDDHDPEVLQINIIEIEDDNGVYANTYIPFHVDVAEYAGKRVLAVPRCCQKRKGTTDRRRVNEGVDRKEGRVRAGYEEIEA